MTSKEALDNIKLWIDTNSKIKGLSTQHWEEFKLIEKELKVFNDLKPYLYISGKQTGSGFPNLEVCVKKPNTDNVYIPFYETKTYEDFILYQEVFKENDK